MIVDRPKKERVVVTIIFTTEDGWKRKAKFFFSEKGARQKVDAVAKHLSEEMGAKDIHVKSNILGDEPTLEGMIENIESAAFDPPEYEAIYDDDDEDYY